MIKHHPVREQLMKLAHDTQSLQAQIRGVAAESQATPPRQLLSLINQVMETQATLLRMVQAMAIDLYPVGVVDTTEKS